MTTIFVIFFFFNDTATTEIYTLSLHDALPISLRSTSTTSIAGMSLNRGTRYLDIAPFVIRPFSNCMLSNRDRKSTRLNSSHQIISYAVFCLKKKKKPYMKTRVLVRHMQC